MEKRAPSNAASIGEGIDLAKLWLILRRNWPWMLLIFIVTIAVAYLKFIRYTPDVYESSSELKLDIKSEATDFGIKTFAEDQNLNIISEEIELIQSNLFLNKALDSLPLQVSYYNKGEFMNFEFFGNPPFHVKHTIQGASLFNTPVFLSEREDGIYLQVGENGQTIKGRYGEPIQLPGVEVQVTKNKNFQADGDLNCFFIINSRDVLLDYLSRNLSAQALDFRANIISISFKDSNPYKARMIVNKIDTLYLQYSYEQKNLANKQKIEWLAKELHQIESKMESYEDYFENFVIENKTSNISEDLKKTVVQLAWVDSQRFEITKRINEVNKISDELQAGNKFTISPSQYVLFPEMTRQNFDNLQKLQIEQDKLTLSYHETTFAFKGLQKEIENTREKINSQLQELKSGWQKKLQELNQAKNRLENEFAGMPDKNTEYNKNQRFYKLYEEFYLMMMQSKSEFEIAQAGTIPDFKILSPATLPRIPIAPNKPLIMGIGVVAGIVFNFFFLGILYLLNNKITSINDLEKLTNVPILGSIPASRTNHLGGKLYILEHPKSIVTESIRTLRTNLDFFGVTSVSKIIAISSTVSGEGKSFVTMNLAGVIAFSKKKVIMLDLDMRKIKTNVPGAVDLSKGISTVLIRKNSWQECVMKTSLENFDYIPSGPQPPNPSELLMNGEFEAMLNDLKQSYDYILLDTPPVGLVTDGIMAMKRADISIYVFRANYSKKDFLHSLQRIININKFNNITTLLNVAPTSGESAYGYGYYEVESSRLKSVFKRK